MIGPDTAPCRIRKNTRLSRLQAMPQRKEAAVNQHPLIINQMITPQGKLSLQSLVTSLHLVPNSILIVKTDGDPMPIVEALKEIELPFDVPIIIMKNDENLLTCKKKDLEEALASAREVGDDRGVARALGNVGIMAIPIDDLEVAYRSARVVAMTSRRMRGRPAEGAPLALP